MQDYKKQIRLIDYSYLLSTAKFGGNYLIIDNISAFRKVINLYISYTLDAWSRELTILHIR